MIGKASLLALLLALPLAAGATPTSPVDGATCSPVPDAAGNLICSLSLVVVARAPAINSCTSLDLDGLGRKLRDTNALGLFAKLALKSEVDIMIQEARTMRVEAPAPDRAAQLRRNFDKFHAALVARLAAEAQIAADIACNREGLWIALITK